MLDQLTFHHGSSLRSATTNSSCEICGHAFAVEKRPGTIGQWLCRRSRPLDADHRNLGADLACFLLLTPLAAASAFLCGSSANYYVNHRQPVGAFGMAFLSTFLFAVYLIWITLTLRSVGQLISTFNDSQSRAIERDLTGDFSGSITRRGLRGEIPIML